jgi:hypothetical protein
VTQDNGGFIIRFEFAILKIAAELIEGLRYKPRMMGVPMDGPNSVFCHNTAAFKNTTAVESILK